MFRSAHSYAGISTMCLDIHKNIQPSHQRLSVMSAKRAISRQPGTDYQPELPYSEGRQHNNEVPLRPERFLALPETTRCIVYHRETRVYRSGASYSCSERFKLALCDPDGVMAACAAAPNRFDRRREEGGVEGERGERRREGER